MRVAYSSLTSFVGLKLIVAMAAYDNTKVNQDSTASGYKLSSGVRNAEGA